MPPRMGSRQSPNDTSHFRREAWLGTARCTCGPPRARSTPEWSPYRERGLGVPPNRCLGLRAWKYLIALRIKTFVCSSLRSKSTISAQTMISFGSIPSGNPGGRTCPSRSMNSLTAASMPGRIFLPSPLRASASWNRFSSSSENSIPCADMPPPKKKVALKCTFALDSI